MEHPFSGSWGYQVTGYFAPTSRFGTPDDFRYFVDRCHQAGLGVILDWVPGTFSARRARTLALRRTASMNMPIRARASIASGARWSSTTAATKCEHSCSRTRSIWLKEFHIDGLRVDAVASMLYLDYSRKEGEWIPNRYGGRENLEAIDFLRRFNELAHESPGAITVAEESTAWPAFRGRYISGGLGFTMKWNMGWMHDMLDYFATIRCSASSTSNEHHLQHALCIHREFRAARFRTTRWCTESGRCSRRCRATNGSVSPTCARFWLHVRASREKNCCSWAARSGRTRSGITMPACPGICSSMPFTASFRPWCRS